MQGPLLSQSSGKIFAKSIMVACRLAKTRPGVIVVRWANNGHSYQYAEAMKVLGRPHYTARTGEAFYGNRAPLDLRDEEEEEQQENEDGLCCLSTIYHYLHTAPSHSISVCPYVVQVGGLRNGSISQSWTRAA